MSTGDQLDALVAALKSAAEPTRLRLLALLSHGELAVGEICRILGQSQPRVSRHLRLLTEAGFLDRFREHQCIYYRTPAHSTRYGWLRQLLDGIDRDEPQLRRDRERMVQVMAARGHAAVRELERRAMPQQGEETTRQFAAAVLEEVGPTGIGELLDIGTGAGSLMAVLARRARHAVGIDISAPALRLARARVHGAGFSHCEFHRGDMYELPCEDAAFDTVTMDRVLGGAQRPADAIGEAARVLRKGGRLIVVDRFDQLDGAPTQSLQQLRRWFTQAGLETQRLRPCDLDCGYYLIATARRAAGPGDSLR